MQVWRYRWDGMQNIWLFNDGFLIVLTVYNGMWIESRILFAWRKAGITEKNISSGNQFEIENC